ncbi:hypothetical protein C5167_025438 [Papaver somniferum]|uniref:DUF7794 domain-containing protein n=1 Tax=Papaver somniferum TaxID=3469 RepID=A0A4Y7JVB1_PAPSO|nr:hypothetical protein C5167_025438 [Papaver somniferum]
MLLSDVTAAVFILLGFARPASLRAESLIKLNKILSPNPFGRPCAVLMLEIPAGVKFGSYIQSTVVLDSVKADVQLPERHEVSMISVGESEDSECNAACMKKELHDLVIYDTLTFSL